MKKVMLLLLLVLAACQAAPSPTSVKLQKEAPYPTATPYPTYTPYPTLVPPTAVPPTAIPPTEAQGFRYGMDLKEAVNMLNKAGYNFEIDEPGMANDFYLTYMLSIYEDPVAGAGWLIDLSGDWDFYTIGEEVFRFATLVNLSTDCIDEITDLLTSGYDSLIETEFLCTGFFVGYYPDILAEELIVVWMAR